MWQIEGLFAKGGPHAWNTHKGGSRLDTEIERVKAERDHIEEVAGEKAA